MRFHTDYIYTDIDIFVREGLRFVRSRSAYDIMYKTQRGSFLALQVNDFTNRVSFFVQRDGSSIAEIRTVIGYNAVAIKQLSNTYVFDDEKHIIEELARKVVHIFNDGKVLPSGSLCEDDKNYIFSTN